MKSPIRVLLVEDHPGYREVITRALKRDPGLTVVSQFGTAEIALRSLRDQPSTIGPDLILLDLNLPGISGLDAMPAFRDALPAAKIVILTQSDREADILKAISLGANGYLLKSSTVAQIKAAIQTVMDGGASLDPAAAKFLLNSLQSLLPQHNQKTKLSERELEILTLLGEGLLKKEISGRLNISVTTVAYHVKHIYEKLQVQNAPAAIAKAYQSGIYPTKSPPPKKSP
jgi:DNA-binding NarL/FixJ family response regulator